MKIVKNEFEGLWAVPADHPRTCANDAPWPIFEMKLESNPIKIWIRGQNTMWFRADQCFVHIRDECLVYQEMHRPNDYAESHAQLVVTYTWPDGRKEVGGRKCQR